MEPQNDRKEMYILSLDNGRIAWIFSIALLVLVFLFLLGYWIGQDTTDKSTNVYSNNKKGQINKDLLSLKNELDRINVHSSKKRINDPDKIISKDNKIVTSPDASKDKFKFEKFSSKISQNEFESLKIKRKPIKVTKVKKAKTKVYSKPNRTARRVKSSRIKRRKKRVSQRVLYSSRGKYSIQIASHTARASANYVQKLLRKKQYKTYIVTAKLNGKNYYRIRVGKFVNYSSAKRIRRQLRNTTLGKDSYIVTN